jgi:hypothetical protein
MSSPSPATLDLAQRLLVQEAAHGMTSEGVGGRVVREVHAVRVCEKLRAVLTIYTGPAGVHSLLTRALALAQAQDPSLDPVRVLPDGSLAGFEKVDAHDRAPGPAANTPGGGGSPAVGGRAAGGQFLVAQVLELLVTFIGEPVLLRLVKEAWPDQPSPQPRPRTEVAP